VGAGVGFGAIAIVGVVGTVVEHAAAAAAISTITDTREVTLMMAASPAPRIWLQ
jgi:hypothetical protein